MTYNTGNAIGSADARDLYDNAQNLDKAMNSTDPTWIDRFGVARPTFKGAESELNQKVDDAEAAATQARGYLNTMRATSYGPLAEDPTTDPLGNPCTAGDEYFNTTYNLLKRFDGSIWRVPEINTENLASGAGSSMVGHGGQTVEAALNERLPEIGNYAALDAYTGDATAVLVYGVQNIFDGGAGIFRRTTDTPSAANGIYRQDAVERWWKRDFTGSLRVAWFGAIGSGDETVKIQAAIDALQGRITELQFDERNYTASALTLKSNITLRGVGSQGVSAVGTRITASGAATLMQASSDDKAAGWYNFSMRGMTLYGAGAGSGNGLNLDGCSNFRLEDVYVQNFLGASKIGFYANKPTNSAGYFSIEDCFFLYNTNNVRICRLNGGYVKGGRIGNAPTGGVNLDVQYCYSILFDNIRVEGANATDTLLYAYANSQITFDTPYFEKGIVKEQNNNDIYFVNPHTVPENTTWQQGAGTNNSSNRIITDATGFGGGASQNLLANGHFSYWNNTTLIGWTLSSTTVAKASNSEITNSSTCQVTSSSTAAYMRQIIRNEKKLLRNGRLKLAMRAKGDADGTTQYSLRVRAHSPTTGLTTLLDLTSFGSNFAVLSQDIDVAAYAAQAGTYNDIDYITVDFFPNINANGISKTAEIDWIVLGDGLVLPSPIPPDSETYIYYAVADANPTLAANSNRPGKLYFNIGTGKLRIGDGSSFVLLN